MFSNVGGFFMAIKKGSEYIESIRKRKIDIFFFGEKIENIIEHPNTRPVIYSVAKTYDLAHVEDYKDVMTAVRDDGEIINRLVYIHKSKEDLYKRVQLARLLSKELGTCNYRCTGSDALNAVYLTTYMIDKENGTDYHERFLRFLDYVQKNDLAVTGALTDVKGSRALRPSEQPDPDMYVRVVEERDDGIIVRGAKIHQSGSYAAHEIIVLPTRAMRENEKEYAVAFAVSPDTEGVKFVLQFNSFEAKRALCKDCSIELGIPKYGIRGTAMMILDDVFIPWDKVFLYGEYKYTRNLIEYFTLLHRMAGAPCKTGFADVVIGGAYLLTKHLEIERSPIIRDKLAEMVSKSEAAYGIAVAAAYEGEKTDAGTYLPNKILANVAKLEGSLGFVKILTMIAELTGGLSVTGPSEKDLKHPEIGKYLQKYLKTGKASAEELLRIEKFLELWIAGPHYVGTLQGGGPPQTQKLSISAYVNWEELEKNVKNLLSEE